MVGRESGIRYAEQTAKQKDRPANTLISLTPLYRTEENRAASARSYIYISSTSALVRSVHWTHPFGRSCGFSILSRERWGRFRMAFLSLQVVSLIVQSWQYISNLEFWAVIFQRGYLMMIGIFIPTLGSKNRICPLSWRHSHPVISNSLCTFKCICQGFQHSCAKPLIAKITAYFLRKGRLFFVFQGFCNCCEL